MSEGKDAVLSSLSKAKTCLVEAEQTLAVKGLTGEAGRVGGVLSFIEDAERELGFIKTPSFVGLLANSYVDEKVVNDYDEKRFSSLTGLFYHDKEVELINEVLRGYGSNNSGLIVLDVPIGTGRLAARLKRVQVGVGFDVSSAMLAKASSRLNSKVWRFVEGNAFNLPNYRDEFKLNSKFDAIISMRFVRHFKRFERERLYKAFQSCLIDGGLFIMDAWNEDLTEGASKTVNVGWNENSLVNELWENGWVDVKLYPYFFVSSLRSLKPLAASKNGVGASVVKPSKLKLKALSVADSLLAGLGARPFSWLVVCRKKGV